MKSIFKIVVAIVLAWIFVTIVLPTLTLILLLIIGSSVSTPAKKPESIPASTSLEETSAVKQSILDYCTTNAFYREYIPATNEYKHSRRSDYSLEAAFVEAEVKNTNNKLVAILQIKLLLDTETNALYFKAVKFVPKTKVKLSDINLDSISVQGANGTATLKLRLAAKKYNNLPEYKLTESLYSKEILDISNNFISNTPITITSATIDNPSYKLVINTTQPFMLSTEINKNALGCYVYNMDIYNKLSTK
jgi:hypothetical protein